MKDISVIVPYYNDNKLRYCLKNYFLNTISWERIKKSN